MKTYHIEVNTRIKVKSVKIFPPTPDLIFNIVRLQLSTPIQTFCFNLSLAEVAQWVYVRLISEHH